MNFNEAHERRQLHPFNFSDRPIILQEPRLQKPDDALLFDRALESVIGNLRRLKNT